MQFKVIKLICSLTLLIESVQSSPVIKTMETATTNDNIFPTEEVIILSLLLQINNLKIKNIIKIYDLEFNKYINIFIINNYVYIIVQNRRML